MINIYFDNVLIDEDNYSGIDNDYKLFTDNFFLGSTECNTFKISINKSVVSTQPTNVRIEEGSNIYHLIVDKIIEEKDFYTYELLDKSVLFNFNYDASIIINLKAQQNEETYLNDILEDMCNMAGVELDENLVLMNNIAVSWYDNTLLARDYLSFIAEIECGFVRWLSNGKLTIIKHKMTSKHTIDIDECKDFILGEKKKITRVVYDNGVAKWEYGNDTGNTLYLNSSNVYIINAEIVENIYNEIKDFEFYSLEVPRCPINSDIRAGDIITFTDGINSYDTIAQYNLSYFARWTGGYKLNIQTKQQEETKILGQKEIIKKIQTEIDRTNARLNITAEQTDENSSSLADLTIESNKIATTVSSLDSSINGEEENDKNLITLSDGSTTVNGLTVTIENNTITINGTATQDTYYNLNQSVFFNVSKYFVDGLLGNLKLVIKNSDEEEIYNGGNGYFEITEELESFAIEDIKLFIPSGTSFNNEELNLILAEVVRDGGILENLNTIKEAVETINSTMMTQTSTAFEMLFAQTGIENTVDSLSALLNSNTTDLNRISQYIRFEGGVISLGASDSQSKLILNKNRISFMTGENESAYITENQLYITDATILRKLQIEKWLIEPDSYGNLNTKWRGDN